MSAGRPRRFSLGSEESRAQSRGECPGASAISRPGFFGLVARVGGGKREEDEEEGEEAKGERFGTGPEEGAANGSVDEPGWRGRRRVDGTGRGGGAISPDGGFVRPCTGTASGAWLGAPPVPREGRDEAGCFDSGTESAN